VSQFFFYWYVQVRSRFNGRVLVQQQPPKHDDTTNTTPQNSFLKTEQRLVNLEDPIARISTLCIHLQSGEERQAFKVNKEDHTSPMPSLQQNLYALLIQVVTILGLNQNRMRLLKIIWKKKSMAKLMHHPLFLANGKKDKNHY